MRGPGREPKNLYKAIVARKKSTLIEFFFDISMKKITVKAGNYKLYKVVFKIPSNLMNETKLLFLPAGGI